MIFHTNCLQLISLYDVSMRAIDSIFSDRTCYKFLNKPVPKELLVKIYDLMKLGPTSSNACPLRIKFVQSAVEKDKLCTLVMESNIPKIKSAPVVALFAYDMKFYEKLSKLHPTNKAMYDYFASLEEKLLDKEALRNSTLQAAYFIMLARGAGLACGPMSGFDSSGVNHTFFKDGNYKVNFICNIGYRDGENSYPKLPRLDFDESCIIL